MDLARSRREVPELELLESTPSTNALLAARVRGSVLADYATLATLDQTAGRGRLDRVWTAPAGTSLAVSTAIRAVDAVGRPVAVERLGWLGMAAGVAMTETVTEEVPAASVGLKWPNDVLVSAPDAPDRKVCGILAEVATGPDGALVVVVGAGVNLTMTEGELPVPTAGSLTLAGAEPEGIVDRVLGEYLRRLRSHASAFLAARGDADHSGLRDRVRELCGTLGRPVRVDLPTLDGGTGGRRGTAIDIDPAGRLVIATAEGDVAVAAGDLTHLRQL